MIRLRVLLTGFEPFEGESVNPSAVIAADLALASPDARLQLGYEVLPVDRRLYAERLHAALDRHVPQLVLALGQAGGRRRVELETTAHNRLDYGGRRDNGGHGASGEPLRPGGPKRLRSSLPLADLARRLQTVGHPVGLSDDAGRHLCNAVYYALLEREGLLAAFAHVPPLPGQSGPARRDLPGVPLDVSRAAVAQLLRLLADLHADATPGPDALGT